MRAAGHSFSSLYLHKVIIFTPHSPFMRQTLWSAVNRAMTATRFPSTFLSPPTFLTSSPSFLTPHPIFLFPQSHPSPLPRRRLFSITASRPAPDAPTLVIVESPAKAATIQAILPPNQFRVRSCVGHIREIPASAKRIPARYKSLPWARLGVDIDDDFRPIYVLIAGKQPVVSQLKTELRGSQQLILATDDDREGEAISWHLTEVLKPAVPVKRAVFHEITPDAIHHAFANCRDINLNLVQAQETRRVLDRLAGYTMSPLLWKKIAKGLSAGRVQSVAMSVIVRREMHRLKFKQANYCSATVNYSVNDRELTAHLSTVDGVRLVKGSDFVDDTGRIDDDAVQKGLWCFDSKAMTAFCNRLNWKCSKVHSVECRRTTRLPPSPLITSTLQQECGNKLGMGAGRTMRIAQKLYENGLITYMRTDNPTLSDQAVASCRQAVQKMYGKEYLRDSKTASSKSRPKAAQAAHEAIRPAGASFKHPNDLPNLDSDEHAMYSIIYRRTLASQMSSAQLDLTTVKIMVPLSGKGDGKLAEFRASGSVIVNSGFLSVYQNENDRGPSTFLPPVSKGDDLHFLKTSIVEHSTKPPARYNDASLVKELEELGVGRPSTYAGIIEKLITRGYIYRGRMLPEDKAVPPRALVPGLTAFAVESLLSNHFPSFMDAQFTAEMEKALDEIAAGSAERTNYLKRYYCGRDGLAALVERTEKEIDPNLYRRILLPNMPEEMIASVKKEASGKPVKKGKEKKVTTTVMRRKKTKVTKKVREGADEDAVDWSTMRVLVSSYGPYVEQNGTVIASLPKSTLADDLSADHLSTVLQIAQDPVIGDDPVTGKPLLLKTSRYGPYVQLGRDEDVAEGEKPKRCSLFPGMDVDTLTVEIASKLLSLPRFLGSHPKSGQEIRAAIGPYGPYVVHDGTYVSLRRDEHNVLEIDFAQALELIDAAEHRKKVRREKAEEKKKQLELAEVDADTSSKKTFKKSSSKSAKRKEKSVA